jgi:prolyl-tRNA editing enzyme YbaK/EbsC (Cys-tRNA(Pro) deacylase)
MAHPNVERVRAALAERGVAVRPVEFPESTRTSAEAAAAIGAEVARIAKSLVFMVGGMPALVIASGASRVDTAKLARLLGAPVKRADADTVRTATGYPIGGVPPAGHAQALRTVIDRDLMAFATVWAAAGTPNAVFEITPADLERVTGGQVADVRVEPVTPENAMGTAAI